MLLTRFKGPRSSLAQLDELLYPFPAVPKKERAYEGGFAYFVLKSVRPTRPVVQLLQEQVILEASKVTIVKFDLRGWVLCVDNVQTKVAPQLDTRLKVI